MTSVRTELKIWRMKNESEADYERLNTMLEGSPILGSLNSYSTYASIIREGVTQDLEEDIRFLGKVDGEVYGIPESPTLLTVSSPYEPGEPHVTITLSIERYNDEISFVVESEGKRVDFCERMWYIKTDETANRLCAELRAKGMDGEWTIRSFRDAFSALSKRVAVEVELALEDAEETLCIEKKVKSEYIDLRKIMVLSCAAQKKQDLNEKCAKACADAIKDFEDRNLPRIAETAILLRKTRDVVGCVPKKCLDLFEDCHGVERVTESINADGDRCRLSVDLGDCIESTGTIYKPLRLVFYAFGEGDEVHALHIHELGSTVDMRGLRDFMERTEARKTFSEVMPRLADALAKRFGYMRNCLAEEIEKTLG